MPLIGVPLKKIGKTWDIGPREGEGGHMGGWWVSQPPSKLKKSPTMVIIENLIVVGTNV